MADKNSVYSDLYKTHYRNLVKYCTSKKIPVETAEDIVSEAYTRSIEKESKFLTLAPAQQRTWLFSAVDYVIKEHYDRRSDTPFSEIEDLEQYINDNDELSVFQSNEEFQDYLQQVYDSLTDECEKKVFTMIVDQKMDYKSISQVCSTSQGAARTMISRLRKKLREIVNKILS